MERENDSKEIDLTNIAQRLKDASERHGLSGAELARISGKSPATVSQVLKGSYKGRPEAAEEILDSVQTHVAGLARSPQSEWTTEGQTLIQSLLAFTYEDAEFSVITGPSGIGKTHTLLAFARRNPGCLYIRCAEGMSPGDIIAFLCQALDLGGASGTILQRLRRCIEAMRSRQIRMVLVDEADLLVGDEANSRRILKKLSFFREINESGVGVALVGLESFEEALRRTGETYVMSRIGYFRKTKAVSPVELEHFWQSLGHCLDDDGRRALRIAPKAGFFRFLAKLSNRAKLLGGDVKGAMLLLFGSSSHIKEI